MKKIAIGVLMLIMTLIVFVGVAFAYQWTPGEIFYYNGEAWKNMIYDPDLAYDFQCWGKYYYPESINYWDVWYPKWEWFGNYGETNRWLKMSHAVCSGMGSIGIFEGTLHWGWTSPYVFDMVPTDKPLAFRFGCNVIWKDFKAWFGPVPLEAWYVVGVHAFLKGYKGGVNKLGEIWTTTAWWNAWYPPPAVGSKWFTQSNWFGMTWYTLNYHHSNQNEGQWYYHWIDLSGLITYYKQNCPDTWWSDATVYVTCVMPKAGFFQGYPETGVIVWGVDYLYLLQKQV